MDALLAELQAARLHMSVNYQDRFKATVYKGLQAV